MSTHHHYHSESVQDTLNMLLRLPEGKYILQKEPLKPSVRLFAVPEDAFDGSSSGSDSEDMM